MYTKIFMSGIIDYNRQRVSCLLLNLANKSIRSISIRANKVCNILWQSPSRLDLVETGTGKVHSKSKLSIRLL